VRRRLTATSALVKSYTDLFVNRRAYTLQSVRPHAESGRHYYYRPKERVMTASKFPACQWGDTPPQISDSRAS
jgi:hypothetical protein